MPPSSRGADLRMCRLWMLCPYRCGAPCSSQGSLVGLACCTITPTSLRWWADLCRLRKQRGTEVDCDAAGAASSAATMFRRRGSSTTLAGQPLPARGSGSSSGSTSSWSWGLFRLLGRRRLQKQMQQQVEQVAGGQGQREQAAGKGQEHYRE